MEQYAGGVITEGHSEELKLRWKEVPQGSLEALLEVLDQLITADEAQQQEKDKVMALVRDEIAALGMELGKMRGGCRGLPGYGRCRGCAQGEYAGSGAGKGQV